MRGRASLIFAAMLVGGLPVAPRAAFAVETNQLKRPPEWAVQLTKPGLPNLYQVTTNLYRGAQPTSRGMAELKVMGIKTVINLRAYHSDKDELVSAGSDFKQGRFHMKAWHSEDKDVIRFLKVVSDTNNLPAFVHCEHGADRTGLMCAMYRITVCGWTKQEAINEMTQGDFGFHRLWENLVTYIKRADIEEIKRRAGIATKLAPGQSQSGK
jgi:protein tyrosine/serine phosphatase